MLSFSTAGESHGRALVVIVEGLPAGLAVSVDDLQVEPGRRRLGLRPGSPDALREDEVTIVGGSAAPAATLGSPVAVEIGNSEWTRSDKWHAEGWRSRPVRTQSPLTQPRPGHADLAGMQKYGFDRTPATVEPGLGARDGRAGRWPAPWPSCCCASSRWRSSSHAIQMGPVRATDLKRPAPCRPRPALTSCPCAASTRAPRPT